MIAVRNGDIVTFRCQAVGYPEPSIQWLKNGQPFTQRFGGRKVIMEKNMSIL